MMAGAMRILYVDDEPNLLEIGKLFLEESGEFSVTTIGSASAALDLLNKEKFDAIISDYQMPGMDGIEFLVEVRTRFGEIPFILFTGKGREEVVIQAINNGVDFYLQKGGDPGSQFAELSHKIKKADFRQRGEKALRESENRYRTIYNKSPIAIELYDAAGILVHANNACLELFGIENIKVIQNFSLFADPNIEDKHKEKLHQGETIHYQGSFDFEKVKTLNLYPTSGGGVIWLDVLITPLGENVDSITAFLVQIQDITERKYAELELVSTQDRLKEAHCLAHIGIWDWVIETDTVTWSEELRNIAGWDPLLPAPTYTELPQVYTPSSWESLRCAVTRALTTGEPYNLELEMVQPNGNIRWTNAFGGVQRDWNGKVIGLHGTVQDITERKRADEALRESRDIIETSPVVVFLWKNNEGWPVEFVSKNVETHLGYTDEEFISGNVDYIKIIHPEDTRRVAEEVARFSDEKGRESFMHKPYRIITKGGQLKWIDDSTNIRRDEGGVITHYQGIIIDITERKRAEDALSQANKKLNLLSDITTHDLKNKVITIQGFLRFARKAKDIDAIQPFLDKIQDSAKTLEHHIDFSKDYQGLGVKLPKWLNLSNMIILASNPAIHIFDETGNLQIFADPLFEKVMYNLVDNIIRHGETATEVHVSVITESENILIIWADNGVGVPTDQKEMIFHWGLGKNTGFGLFLIREILAITGMTMQETGEPGKGARFEITVPNGKWRMNKDDDV